MIRTLEEKHKRFAEMLLTGRPPTMREKAEALGVDRSTLYHWVKDPLFQKYAEKLAEELEAARVERMVPLVFNACEAVQACLGNAVRDLQSDSEQDRQRAPGLSTLVSAVKTLAELERVDRGKPATISRSETQREEKPNPAAERVMKWMAELAASDDENEASETHTAPVTH